MSKSGEVRGRDPNTGGEKGVKDDRQDLIPSHPIGELGRVYGYGAKKYTPDNWRKGYNWRWSAGALLRHFHAWNRGETLDPETGLHHLAHAMWHCVTLQEFERLGLGTDDRYCTQDKPSVWESLCSKLGEPEFTPEAKALMAQHPPGGDRRDRVYIAGPMRHHKLYNFPAFDAAAASLASRGYEPVSPADLDRDAGNDPAELPADHDWSSIPNDFDFAECRKRDMAAIETCDAIYMLPGWKKSKGACAEHAYSIWKGIEPMGAEK